MMQRPAPSRCVQVSAATVDAPSSTDWAAVAQELDQKSPLEIMDRVSGPQRILEGEQTCLPAAWASCLPEPAADAAPARPAPHPSWQALEAFGDEIGIAFSGAEDVALIEYAHLTGRPYRVFR